VLLDCEGGRKGARAASPPRPRPTNAHAHFTFPSDLLAIVQVGVVVCLLYAALVAATGTPFLPPTGAWWTVLLIWAAAHAGGLLLSRAVPIMPPLLGMLAAGVVLRNVSLTIDRWAAWNYSHSDHDSRPTTCVPLDLEPAP
jgi:hypothetical protein